MTQSLTSIHPNAKIGPNVQIEPFVVIYDDVEIEEGTWIGSHVTIMSGARIGKNCRIFPGAVISAIPQDLKFQGEQTFATIGDNTTIRECVTINRGTSAHGKTEIGHDCLIMAYSHIAHDCIIGNHCIVVNNVQMGGHVEMDDWAIIGGSSSVHQFCKIGTHAMVAGGSLIRQSVPPYVMAAREPLRFAGINRTGLSRRGFSAEQMAEIKAIYSYFYLKGLNNTDALQQILTDFESSTERDSIVHFLESNEKRGIIKGSGRQKEKDSDS